MKDLLTQVRNYFPLVVISGFIVAFDQWSKAAVRSSLELGESWIPFEGVGHFFRIVHWHNSGAAFGLLPQASTLFTIIAMVVAVVIVIYWPRVPRKQWALRLALAMQLGGALGNLLSRLTIGVVTDFIAVGNFPVFNVADSSISVGVAILIIATWIDERRIRNEERAIVEEDERDRTVPEVDPSV